MPQQYCCHASAEAIFNSPGALYTEATMYFGEAVCTERDRLLGAAPSGQAGQ